jgi:hypothetical protein
MTKKELVSSYELFYHVTKRSNIEAIDAIGLKITEYSPIDFYLPEKRRPQVCFTILAHLPSIVSAMEDRYESEIAIYSIPAVVLANKQFGLDYTHIGIQNIKQKHTVAALGQMIDNYGTIACFENIPGSEIQMLRGIPANPIASRET